MKNENVKFAYSIVEKSVNLANENYFSKENVEKRFNDLFPNPENFSKDAYIEYALLENRRYSEQVVIGAIAELVEQLGIKITE